MASTISATVSPLVPQGSASPLQLSSITTIRASSQRLGSIVANQLATDLTNIQTQVNGILTAGQQGPSISQLLLTNQQGQVTAALGDLTYQGVVYTNFFSEIHVGDPLNTHDPQRALFNANTDGSVSIGQSGWLDVHDEFDGNAAWIGTQNDTLQITNAYNNGSGAIRLTVPNHDFVTGDAPQVRNMQLAGVPNGTGTWTVTVIDAKTVDLQGSVWAGAFTAPANPPAGIDTFSPTIDRLLQVIGAVNLGGLIDLQTNVAHNYETGDRVDVPKLPGISAGIGQWTVTVIDPTHFTLDASVFSGVFLGPGTCLRFYAGMLAQQFAIGDDFPDYKLRAFADGSLKIRNATITVTSAAGSILIDPTVPEIVLSSGTTLAKIVLNAATPSIELFDALGILSVSIDADGNVSARSIGQTGAFTGSATVRNAAGTGMSTFVFANGVCTSFTP